MTVRTEQRLRYGYYFACFAGLEVLHLLTIRPPDPVSMLAPVGVLVTLIAVSLVVRARQEGDSLLVSSIASKQRDYFNHEYFVYIIVALFSLIVFREIFHFSLSDSLYDTLFILVLGFFAAVDKTLAATRTWYAKGLQQQADTFRLISISSTLKRAVFSLLVAVLLCLAIVLFRLYDGLGASGMDPIALVIDFGLELLFFFLVIGYLMLRITRRYAVNTHHILESQFKVVRDVQAGDYSQNVPLLTQGELGLMGMQLNRLLDYMRKRQDIENMLKRVVSPDIMEKLISTDTEQLKRGEEREVAILFCDIRGFTEMSEGTSAADIIFFLNSFFSELTEVVSRNHGTVNKFMGDAILAVYSADTASQAIDAAMNTAYEITMRVRQMRLPNGGSPETGSGIHFGRVVAGTIGSDHRYEYTFLGDAVNTASRLQGLSKRFGYPIIVSAEAYDMLSPHLQLNLADLGQHMVRGKSEAIHVYGGPDEGRE
jgi:class 3 adenylate cyclase